jgi:sulfopyruvate decarboxylase TPP-binding subunit
VFTGIEFAAKLAELGFTHVVWVPDSEVGPWEEALESSPRLRLVRVCREGEAWPLAAGLHLGGQVPLIVMQSTGLFESGDALRNVLFDLRLPLFSLIGVRNGLVSESRDSARTFAEPILQAWGLDCVWLRGPHDKPRFAEHVLRCRRSGQAGVALLAERALA